MGLWRTVLKYWLTGGKRRWFARAARRLPVVAQGGRDGRPALGATLFEAVAVGLDVDADRALALLLACDPHATAAYADPGLEGAREHVLRRAVALESRPASRVGWTIAKRLNHPVHLKTFGRQLALYWAGTADSDALVQHLDDCLDRGTLDREMLGAVVAAASAQRGVRDNPGWRLCLSCCHERLGDLQEALRVCPAAQAERRLQLVEQLERAALQRDRAEVSALVQQIGAAIDKLHELERRAPAAAWQRHFAAWQRSEHGQAIGRLDPGDDAVLAEMYNGGQMACDQWLLALDRARNLRPRHQRLIQATGELSVTDTEAGVDNQLRELRVQSQLLADQTAEVVATLDSLENQFQRWSATRAHVSSLRADPRDRLAICHDAGDWHRSLEAYHQAFASTPPAEVPPDAVHRHLDGLARLGRRERYRQVLAEQRERLTLYDLQFDRLNEFGRHVRPAIAWVFASGRGTGSGFLAAPGLVVTSRHVVSGDHGATPSSIMVHVGGAPRPVARLRFAPNPEIDLAVLELAAPLDGVAMRIGYTSLVEIGERVVAIGFPLPEGDSFEENLLLDHGIVNRIRTRPDRHGRELEVGLRLSPGMSGGPVFNDRGEVIGINTFVRYQTSNGQHAPFVDKSAHAIAVDALHELLPRPW